MAKILIAEDNPANLELARFLLEAAGHEVVAAADAAAHESRRLKQIVNKLPVIHFAAAPAIVKTKLVKAFSLSTLAVAKEGTVQ